jgi:hypothetical protein
VVPGFCFVNDGPLLAPKIGVIGNGDMDAKVVDTSVLAALVFGEPRSEEALRLLHEKKL